jgi:hypothetical protein
MIRNQGDLFAEANLYPPHSVPVSHDIAAAVRRVDFRAYQGKAGDVANRLSLMRIDLAHRPSGGRTPSGSGSAVVADIHSCVVGSKSRRARRPARKVRALSAAGKARVDLQIKMLGAIPVKARSEFLGELADHARKYPSSARYLRNLADQGDDVARAVVARIGNER